MRIKHLTALLLSLVLIISLSATVPASAMVEIPQSEPDETLMCSDDLQGFDDTLETYGIVGVGFFNEREKVEFLEMLSTPDADNYKEFFPAELKRNVGYTVWYNTTIKDFKDEVNFIGLNPNYIYEIAYTLDGKSEVELLDKETWIWKIPSDKLTADDVSIYISDNEARDHTVIATLKEFNEGGAYVSQIEERQPNKVVDETKYVSSSFDNDTGILTIKWDYTNVSKKVDLTVTAVVVRTESVTGSASADTVFYLEPNSLKGEVVANFDEGCVSYEDETVALSDIPHNREMTVWIYQNKIYGSMYDYSIGTYTWEVEGVDDYQTYQELLETLKTDEDDDEEEETYDPTYHKIDDGALRPGNGSTEPEDVDPYDEGYDHDYDPFDDDNTGGTTIYDLTDEDGNPLPPDVIDDLIKKIDEDSENLPTQVPENVVYRSDSEYVQTGIETSGSHTVAILFVIAGILGLAIVGVVVLGKRGKNNVQK